MSEKQKPSLHNASVHRPNKTSVADGAGFRDGDPWLYRDYEAWQGRGWRSPLCDDVAVAVVLQSQAGSHAPPAA